MSMISSSIFIIVHVYQRCVLFLVNTKHCGSIPAMYREVLRDIIGHFIWHNLYERHLQVCMHSGGTVSEECHWKSPSWRKNKCSQTSHPTGDAYNSRSTNFEASIILHSCENWKYRIGLLQQGLERTRMSTSELLAICQWDPQHPG